MAVVQQAFQESHRVFPVAAPLQFHPLHPAGIQGNCRIAAGLLAVPGTAGVHQGRCISPRAGETHGLLEDSSCGPPSRWPTPMVRWNKDPVPLSVPEPPQMTSSLGPEVRWRTSAPAPGRRRQKHLPLLQKLLNLPHSHHQVSRVKHSCRYPLPHWEMLPKYQPLRSSIASANSDMSKVFNATSPGPA